MEVSSLPPVEGSLSALDRLVAVYQKAPAGAFEESLSGVYAQLAKLLKRLGYGQAQIATVLSLLSNHQLAAQVLDELILDSAIASIACTSEEQAIAIRQFYQERGLRSEDEQQAWHREQGITPTELKTWITRQVRIRKFQRSTWEQKLPSYFLQRKSQLDRVIYSYLQVNNAELARELYFRIQDQEQSFSELARAYSQGPEAQTHGLIGPVELGKLHPTLVKIFSTSHPGQLWAPMSLEGRVVIVRLEQFIPAQLNERVQERLYQELLSAWLQEQRRNLAE